MYKLVYEENGVSNMLTSTKKRPLELLMRHLFNLHCAYRQDSTNFEVIFFGKKEQYNESKIQIGL